MLFHSTFLGKKMKNKKKKSIHELAKQFPDKTYRELEKYRDADRWEEAEAINVPNVIKDDPNNHDYE